MSLVLLDVRVQSRSWSGCIGWDGYVDDFQTSRLLLLWRAVQQ